MTVDDFVLYGGGGIEEIVFLVCIVLCFIHNVECLFGKDVFDLKYGDLIYVIEEEFVGGVFLNGCVNDGLLFIVSLDGSYGG